MQNNLAEICVLCWVMDIWNCIFPISTMQHWNFQMTTTCLILLWELGRDDPPTATFFYSTWMQEKFWTICVLYSVVNIWNWTCSISTMQIEIFKWLNSLNIALETWQRKPSDGDDPHQVHSCTLPNCEIMFK